MYKVNDDGTEYYIIDRIKDIQRQMFHLLKLIDSVCRENNLQYFLDGGSAIGAYRHGGFIPWDDDLDISMLKQDYIKLISILKGMDQSKFFLFDYDHSLHCCGFFGEKVPLFSSIDEKRRHIYPIKIDIRPLNVIENKEESIRENRIYRELANYLLFGRCSEEYKQSVFECFDRKFGSDKKKFMLYYNTEYGLCNEKDNAVLVHPYMEYSSERMYRYDEVFPLKCIKFFDFDTFVPSTDTLLTEVYGNYLEMPSLEDRKPEAGKVFDAVHFQSLYKYLIDKTEKNFMQRIVFSLEATLFCK